MIRQNTHIISIALVKDTRLDPEIWKARASGFLTFLLVGYTMIIDKSRGIL